MINLVIQHGDYVTAIVRDNAELLSSYADDAGLAFELKTNVATAGRSR